MTLFTAKLNTRPISSALTYGKVYDVVDFSDWTGTYTILNDRGERCCLDWHRFEDQGKASTAYERNRNKEN